MAENRQARRRRHHVVPRFLLRRFANERDEIFVADHLKHQGFITSIANAAVETDFYTIDVKGRDKDAIEKRLSHVETAAAASLPRILGADYDINDRDNVFAFVALQATRGPVFRSRLEAFERSRAEKRRQVAAADRLAIGRFLRAEDGREPTPAEIDAFAADLIQAQLAVNVPREYSVVTALMAASDLVSQMSELQVFVLECSEVTFVTSDNPVQLVFPPTSEEHLSVQECGLSIAVDPYHMLFAVPRHPAELLAQDCSELRRRTYASTKAAARRFTYCHPDISVND